MDELSMEIGRRLKLLRDEKDYSIRYVEDKTEIPKTTINSYENGNVDHKIKVLIKLAEFYKEDINWIICETNKRRYEK